jgi:hypothetical protein
MTLLESIAAITVSIISIVGSAMFGIRWLVKHYFDEIKHELKPNSGQSIKDQVTRLEKNFSQIEHQQKEADTLRKEMNKKIDHMYDVLLDYISKSVK